MIKLESQIIVTRYNRFFSHSMFQIWDLWRKERALDIVDSSVGYSYEVRKVMRCIHVGHLCMQEYAPDRPTM